MCVLVQAKRSFSNWNSSTESPNFDLLLLATFDAKTSYRLPVAFATMYEYLYAGVGVQHPDAHTCTTELN